MSNRTRKDTLTWQTTESMFTEQGSATDSELYSVANLKWAHFKSAAV